MVVFLRGVTIQAAAKLLDSFGDMARLEAGGEICENCRVNMAIELVCYGHIQVVRRGVIFEDMLHSVLLDDKSFEWFSIHVSTLNREGE